MDLGLIGLPAGSVLVVNAQQDEAEHTVVHCTSVLPQVSVVANCSIPSLVSLALSSEQSCSSLSCSILQNYTLALSLMKASASNTDASASVDIPKPVRQW